MFTPDTNYAVALEQQKDHIRNAERRQLLNIATANQPNWCRRRCAQLGRLLKTWGTQLEQVGQAAPAKRIATEV